MNQPNDICHRLIKGAIKGICALDLSRTETLNGPNHTDRPHETLEELNGIETTLSQISSPTGKSHIRP